jgi:hypothetical protein
MLSVAVAVAVAVIREALERRRRRRWSVLAQHVMIELVGNTRLVWTGVIEPAGLMPSDAYTKASTEAGTRAVRDTPGLAEAIRELVADGDRWRRESQSNPAVQWIPELEHEFDDDWLADRVVAISQLAEELDRGSLKLALRIVPFEWWTARHGIDTP